MIWTLIVILLVLAVVGGLAVHPLLWLIVLLALAAYLLGPYRRVP